MNEAKTTRRFTLNRFTGEKTYITDEEYNTLFGLREANITKKYVIKKFELSFSSMVEANKEVYSKYFNDKGMTIISYALGDLYVSLEEFEIRKLETRIENDYADGFMALHLTVICNHDEWNERRERYDDYEKTFEIRHLIPIDYFNEEYRDVINAIDFDKNCNLEIDLKENLED